MPRELKKYRFTCDHCGDSITTEGLDQRDARPRDWEVGTHECGDSYCTGGHPHEYCPRHIPKEYKNKPRNLLFPS